MTARNGPQQPTATQRKVGAVFKLQKWRLHHHDKRKRKRKVQDLARQFRKTKQQEETKKIYTSKFTIKTNSEAFLPTDPLKWSPQHVRMWVHLLSKKYQFTFNPSLFTMNGKALCLMTLYGFRFRSPEGGAILYADLRMKLLKQIYFNNFES